MSAKEMFEKLGYDYYIKRRMIVCQKVEYFNVCDDEEDYERITFIYFFIDEKKITIMGHFLTLEVLQAINKQVEELGWNK